MLHLWKYTCKDWIVYGDYRVNSKKESVGLGGTQMPDGQLNKHSSRAESSLTHKYSFKPQEILVD